jgi:subtilisin family serine protease/subtilisin-like proprotein convertase family protein
VRWQFELELLEDRALPAVTDFSALQVDPTTYASDSILVRFQADAPMSVMPSLYAGTSIGDELGLVSGLHEVLLDPGVSVVDALAAYQANPWVLYAEPNYLVSINVVPNDPSFSRLYGLNNTGQTGGTVDADIDAPEAWDNFTGSGNTIVAVIDTGVDYNHPDLAANIWTNPGEIPNNGLDDDSNGFVDDVHGYDFANNDGNPFDDNGHGTHVSGTIGAVGNNAIGVAGVIWDVQIMAVKFLDAGGGGTLADAVRAVNYAVANGALISNNSWGGGGFYQALYDAIANAGAQGHIFVAAAGNNSSNNDAFPAYPASYNLDNIIAVAATDDDDLLAYFSNYGATSVDLGAPGVDIYSTLPNNGYGYLSGTSMATPHVTGVVAMVRDLHPTWTVQQVKDQILGTVDPVASLAGKTVTGGRVNLYRAATGQPPPDTRGPRITAHSPTSTSQNVSSLRVTFNEAINPLTFDPSDIASFIGPAGSITVDSVAPVPGSNDRSFDIFFAEQSTRGNYTMVIGPDIRDTSDNQMNQDNDGTNGENPQDQYTARFDISDRLIFPSDDVPAPIYDGSVTISYLTINQDVTIVDLDLGLDITHTWDADLYIHLYSPTGANINLALFRGGSGDNFTDTIFDDEAATPISGGLAPFTGRYRPENPLSVLDGMNARGTWQLWIEDWYFLDEGMLNAWYLSIQPGEGGPPPDDNNPPDAVADTAQTQEEVPVVIAVLANDSDPDNDPLTVTQVSNVQNGSATINPDNTVTFTPNPDFSGTGSFVYTISDGQGGTDSALVTIIVSPINDGPIAVDDFGETERDTFLTFDGFMAPRLESNDIDADGDLLGVIDAGNATNGTVILNNGVATFFPNSGFVGTATFTYTVSDGQATDEGLVTIDVVPGNQGPIAVDDFAVGIIDRFLTFDGFMAPRLESNDLDADGDLLEIISVGNPTNGSVLLNNGIATFFPNPGFVGNASFTYVVSDGELTDEGLVTMRFTGEYLFSATAGGTLTGTDGVPVTFADADIVRLKVTASGHEYSLFFDGSNFGLTTGNEDIDAFTFLADGSLVVSTAGSFSVPGPGGTTLTGGGEDLLRFTPSTPGNYTAGTWSFYFDGSDVGLSGSNENIDAVAVLSDGRVLISTSGFVSVSGASGEDEDLLAFYGQLGANTLGSWSFYFDGSDVGLASNNGEDIDGLFVREYVLPSGLPRLFFNTVGNFSVPGVSGANEDVFAFNPTSLGANTAGSYGPGLGLDGDTFGLDSFDLDGFSMRPPQTSGAGAAEAPPSSGGSAGSVGDSSLAGLLPEDLAPLTPAGPRRRRR